MEKSLEDRFTIAVKVDVDDDEVISMSNDFTWEIAELTENSFSLQFSFTYPDVFIYDQEIEVYCEFSDFVPDWDDEAVVQIIKIPSQVSTSPEGLKQVENILGAAGSAQAATISSFVITALTSASLSQVWGLLNGIEMQAVLPLVKLSFPARSKLVLNKLIEISNLELVDSKEIIYGEMPYKFRDVDENFVHEDSMLIGKDTN